MTRVWFCFVSSPPRSHTPRSAKVKPVGTDVEHCKCETKCDSHCLNVILRAACFGDPTTTKGKGGNCAVGPTCSNRVFQGGQFVRTQAFSVRGHLSVCVEQIALCLTTRPCL